MFGVKTKLKRIIAGLYYRRDFTPAGSRSLASLPLHTKIGLEIPTYDGSGQAVHPDIFYDQSIGKYVLAFTPYPYTDDRFENPCVVLSDDGIRFYEEREGMNPLAPPPEKDHNDDPDVSLHDGVYSLLYLETVRPDYQNVIVLQSRDRLNWERKLLYHQELGENGGDLILSPAAVWDGETCHCFFVMGNYDTGHRILAMTGTDVTALDFAAAAPVELDGIPAVLRPWHVDVFADGPGGYLMLLCLVAQHKDGKGGSYFLHLARSRDLQCWRVDPAPLIRNCYRSSGFVRDGILYVYFSSNHYADEWRTGLYKVALD